MDFNGSAQRSRTTGGRSEDGSIQSLRQGWAKLFVFGKEWLKGEEEWKKKLGQGQARKHINEKKRVWKKSCKETQGVRTQGIGIIAVMLFGHAEGLGNARGEHAECVTQIQSNFN